MVGEGEDKLISSCFVCIHSATVVFVQILSDAAGAGIFEKMRLFALLLLLV